MCVCSVVYVANRAHTWRWRNCVERIEIEKASMDFVSFENLSFYTMAPNGNTISNLGKLIERINQGNGLVYIRRYERF